MAEARVHIPDGVFVFFSIVVVALTAILLIYAFPYLPSRIPTHYDLTGHPDAYTIRSVPAVFLPFIIQFILTAGLIVLRRWPQYAFIPGTLFLNYLPKNIRQNLEGLVKHMLVVTTLIVDLIFAHLALSMIMVAFHVYATINNWIILGLILVLLAFIMEYSLLMVRVVRRVVQTLTPNQLQVSGSLPIRPEADLSKTK